MAIDGWTRRDFFRRTAAMGAVAIGGAPLLSACSEAGGALDLEKLKNDGFIKVGLSNEKPFGFVATDGTVAGQSPAVCKAVFEELGVKDIQPSPVAWDGLIPGLKSGRFDVIAAGMFITPDRCAEVTFSEPTAQSPEAFMVDKGNPKNLTDFESVVKNKAKVAVLNASVEQTYAEEFGVPAGQIELIPDQTTGFDLLKAGRVDAISMLHVSHTFLLKDLKLEGKYDVTEPFFPVVKGEEQRGVGALAFRSDDSKIVDEVNRVIAEFKESGKLLELGQEWGFDEASLPGDATTAELCK